MRKNIETVMHAFVNGGYANEKTIHTDGTTLYSYAMPIARRVGVCGSDYYVKAKGPSNTTNTHISGCKQFLSQNGIKLNLFV